MDSSNPIRFACLFALTLLAACDRSSKPASKENTSTKSPAFVTALNAPLSECPERVWPGANEMLADAQVLITELDNEWAYLWQATEAGPAVLTIKPDTLQEEWLASFNFGEFQGRQTLGFNATDWPFPTSVSEGGSWQESNLPILFHEAFHFFLQENFVEPGNSSRSQDYPIRWEPRYLRAELLQALRESLQAGQSLSIAAYWWEQYLTSSLQEAMAISRTDRVEGSANYAEIIMTALADLGCSASEEDLLARALNYLPAPYSSREASSESYVLGAYAGLLLRQTGTTQWESRVEAGETLIEVLLENVTSIPQPIDRSLQSLVQADIASANDRLAENLDSSIAAMNNTQNYRLVLGSENSVGSFSTSGFYRLTEHEDLGEVTLEMSALYSYGTGVRIINSDGFQLGSTIPCDIAHSRVFSLGVEELIDNQDGSVTYEGTDISFTRLPATIIDQDGYRWICPNQQ